MSRRDTIIIAVLLNAGVLAILFMLAVSDREGEEIYSQSLPAIVRVESPVKESKIIAAAKPSPAEEFVDFNLDDVVSTNEDLFESYSFSNEPIQESAKTNKQPAVQSSSSSSDAYAEVTVKRGDSLEKLARNNGTTVDVLRKANNLKSDLLNIGQVVRVPNNSKLSTKPQEPKSETKKNVAEANNPVYYTIKTGDSPWKIARQNNMNPDELLRLNNLNEEKARNLKIGDRIRIK